MQRDLVLSAKDGDHDAFSALVTAAYDRLSSRRTMEVDVATIDLAEGVDQFPGVLLT